MRFLLIFLLPVILAACSNAADENNPIDSTAFETLSLKVTGDISLPSPMLKAAFLPNTLASNESGFNLSPPGHIILLSTKGGIWQTTTEGEEPILIAHGDYTDIWTSQRSNGTSVLLTLNEAGQLTAFVKEDDAQDFTAVPASQNGADIQTFCQGGDWAVTNSGELRPLSLNIQEGSVVEVSTGDAHAHIKSAMSCSVGETSTVFVKTRMKNKSIWQRTRLGKAEDIPHSTGLTSYVFLSGGLEAGLTSVSGSPVLVRGETAYNIMIEDGLSIRGLENANFMAVTSEPMGTVFSGGMILLADQKAPRLVMISLEYAARTLADQ